ncbi:MAG: hypothetical protein ABI611_06565 [Solirubrobacteraceae bacterium]
MTEETPAAITDDDAARVDVPALLGQGLADEAGGLRGELQGEGALAAAVQLQRDGAGAEDVALALSQVRSRAMGIDLEPADLPPRLAAMADACAGGDPELLAEWLGLVANLMMLRTRHGGAA